MSEQPARCAISPGGGQSDFLCEWPPTKLKTHYGTLPPALTRFARSVGVAYANFLEPPGTRTTLCLLVAAIESRLAWHGMRYRWDNDIGLIVLIAQRLVRDKLSVRHGPLFYSCQSISHFIPTLSDATLR